MLTVLPKGSIFEGSHKAFTKKGTPLLGNKLQGLETNPEKP